MSRSMAGSRPSAWPDMAMDFHGLRIVLVGPLPPPAGGMANQTRQLAELLRGEGAEVQVVQVNAPYRPVWAGRLKGVRALFRLVPYVARLWSACGRADLVHIMANSGWSWHLFAAPAVWMAALRATPVVVNYRGGEAGPFLQRAGRRVRLTIRLASMLLLPSGFLLDLFARHGMLGRVVPNIIDLERFQPPSVPRAIDRPPHLVVARNLEPIYGIDTVLEAFALIVEQFPGATLSVAGSGPEAGALAALAQRLGIDGQVTFTGRLDRDEMAALYRSADAMLNASRVDNMPNAVLEALASGVPVVTTNVGGIPYIVADRHTGMLVPPDDPPALAQAACELLSDTDLHRSLKENGLADVRQYRWASVRGVLAAAYADVLQAATPQLTRKA